MNFFEKILENLYSGWELNRIMRILCASIFLTIFFYIKKNYNIISGKASANDIGWLRIIICLVAFIYTLQADSPSIALIPDSSFKGHFGIMQLLDFEWIYSIHRNYWLLFFLKIITLVMLFLSAIGYKIKWLIPTSTLIYFMLMTFNREFSVRFHEGQIVFYFLMLISLFPNHGLILIRKKNKWIYFSNNEQTKYYGDIYLTFLIMLSCIYFLPGLNKLVFSELSWWNPINVKYITFEVSLNLTPLENHRFPFVYSLGDLLYLFMGIFVVISECLAFLIIFNKKIIRHVYFFILITLNLGILITMQFVLIDAILLAFILIRFSELIRLVPENLTNFSDKSKITQEKLNRSFPRYVGSIVCFAMFVTWTFQIEYYPITSWEMFGKRPVDNNAYYTKLIGVNKDGDEIRIDPGKIIGALSDGKYLRNIEIRRKKNFTQKEFESTKIFLNTIAMLYNSKLNREGEKLVEIKVQDWIWDFVMNPGRPEDSILVQSTSFIINE